MCVSVRPFALKTRQAALQDPKASKLPSWGCYRAPPSRQGLQQIEIARLIEN